MSELVMKREGKYFLNFPSEDFCQLFCNSTRKAAVYVRHTFGPFLEILLLPRKLKQRNEKDFVGKMTKSLKSKLFLP